MMNFKQWLILSETITVKDQEFREPLTALKHIQETHPNPENLVVTFTAIDKVGINPKSGYDTPLGIYFYPIDYVIEKRMNVPFAKEQPYINVCEFTRPDKILHMTDDVNNQKGLELLNVFPQEEVDVAIESLENNYELRSNYSKLWLVTREIAFHKPILWNANLRKCEIDGFVDHGTGTIHGNEPTQGVVFTGTALRRILVIPQILRKPLPDINKITLNQLENLLKNRNLFNNDIDKFLNDAENKDEIARIIIQYKPELSNDDITTLLHYVENKDEIARILGSDNINKLSDDDIYSLLRLTKNKDEMAGIFSSDNINKLSDENVFNLLIYAKNKGQMARILGPDNINKLTAKNVSDLLEYASGHKKMAEMAEILGQENINKLTNSGVYSLLSLVYDKEEMARILGQKNIDKLSGDYVLGLLRYASDQDQIARILGPNNINKLDDQHVNQILYSTPDQEKMINFIIKYKTELSGGNVSDLLHLHIALDKEKMAEILGPENINKLTAKNVSDLLEYASRSAHTSMAEMVEILGSDNINKLSDENVFNLLHDAFDKDEKKQILRKYYTGKDTNIISLLNQ